MRSRVLLKLSEIAPKKAAEKGGLTPEKLLLLGATSLGKWKMEHCAHVEDGVCHNWYWADKASIAEYPPELVVECGHALSRLLLGQHWHLKAHPERCATCPSFVDRKAAERQKAIERLADKSGDLVALAERSFTLKCLAEMYDDLASAAELSRRAQEFGSLLGVIKREGQRKAQRCQLYRDGKCMLRAYLLKPIWLEDQDPEPLERDGKWYVKLHYAQCALCTDYREE